MSHSKKTNSVWARYVQSRKENQIWFIVHWLWVVDQCVEVKCRGGVLIKPVQSRHQGNCVPWGNTLKEVGRVQYGFEEAENQFCTEGQLGHVHHLLTDREGVKVKSDLLTVHYLSKHTLCPHHFFHTVTAQPKTFCCRNSSCIYTICRKVFSVFFPVFQSVLSQHFTLRIRHPLQVS